MPARAKVEPTPNLVERANLEVLGLRVDLGATGVDIVDEISFAVGPGAVTGLVGESGSGKTTVALALLGAARPGARIVGGQVLVAGGDVLAMSPRQLRAIRGALISYLPQDPSSALNPSLRIEEQIHEALSAHDFGGTEQARRERMVAVLEDVKLPSDRHMLRRFPHQLSGGQQQRAALAMAFACRPRVIVMDEPTTGLDVSTQAHILETVRQLSSDYAVSVLYVSHDLAVISEIADDVLVMYGGRIVDEGPARDVLGRPEHPYTIALRKALPEVERRRRLDGIPGAPPMPGTRPAGCGFADRCPFAEAECRAAEPPLVEVRDGRLIRCVRLDAVRQAPIEPATPPAAPAPATSDPGAVLSVTGLTAGYGEVEILHDVGLELMPGQCLALVGESGSGKTTLTKAIAGIHTDRSGSITHRGTELALASRDRPPEMRRRIQYIFQNPFASLSPRRTIGSIIAQPLSLLLDLSRRELRDEVARGLDQVSLRPGLVDRYPDELSGGERQRVAIARALAVKPEVLLCDEITSALDVSVQALILTMLRELQRDLGLSLLFTTHNLAVVSSIADEVVVLQDGAIVERGPVEEVLGAPTHAYTRALLADSPKLVVPR
jgi:peptide/nickel transport system ATP-binding protein